MEAAKRAEREKDVLLAEKHVWTMAHSGVQAELVKNLANLEKEKQVRGGAREGGAAGRQGGQGEE